MIASAVESDLRADRTRKLLVIAIVVLGATTVATSLVATHYRHQITQLRAHPPAVATVRGTPSPSQQPSPMSVATAATLSAPATGIPATGRPIVSAPPLATTSYELDTGAARTTVYLASAASQGAGSTTGQLLVTALIRGATVGAHYRLIGGDCEPTSPPDVVWAEGTADASGTAYLIGVVRTLPKGDQYFMTIDPWHPTASAARLIPSLEGDFVLGEAEAFVGHVTRVAGVGGGECVVGP